MGLCEIMQRLCLFFESPNKWNTRKLESYPALIISGTSGRRRAGITSGSLFWENKKKRHQELFGRKKNPAGRFLSHQGLFGEKKNPAGRFLSHQGLSFFLMCVSKKSLDHFPCEIIWFRVLASIYDSGAGSGRPCILIPASWELLSHILFMYYHHVFVWNHATSLSFFWKPK